MKCNNCGSENVVKSGVRQNKSGSVQRYVCNGCNRKFVERDILHNVNNKVGIFTLSLDLYFKGLSLRKVRDHLYQFYGIKMSHVTILNWVYSFSMFASQFSKKIKVKSSEEWNADETVLYFKRNPYWMWNVMDKNTKFFLATQIAKYRTVDGCNVFKNSRRAAMNNPKIITTDSFPGYPRLVRESVPKARHKAVNGIRQRKYSNTIERFHGNVKERYKVTRGFKSENGANLIMNGWKAYYNFIRPHMGINNMTPAQAAGINLNLGRNRWEGLINAGRRSVK